MKETNRQCLTSLLSVGNEVRKRKLDCFLFPSTPIRMGGVLLTQKNMILCPSCNIHVASDDKNDTVKVHVDTNSVTTCKNDIYRYTNILTGNS
jgi:hypothetical protein